MCTISKLFDNLHIFIFFFIRIMYKGGRLSSDTKLNTSIKTYSTQYSIFVQYKENMNMNMFLFVSNHDNENLMKNWSETKNVYPAQKHIYVK